MSCMKRRSIPVRSYLGRSACYLRKTLSFDKFFRAIENRLLYRFDIRRFGEERVGDGLVEFD
jgi:hypothetical protein